MTPARSTLFAAGVLFLTITGGIAYFAGIKNASSAQTTEASDESENLSKNEGPPPAIVHVSKTISTELSPLSEALGSVVSLRDSLIAAATLGKVDWVENIGTEVEQGAVIARIDPADARFARDAAASDVKQLEVRAGYLARLYQRFEDLGDDGGESESSLDEMRTNRDEVQQTLLRARASLRQAQINLDRTEVRAPFAGRIASQEIQIGEFANAGAPIIRLVDTKSLEVTAQAPAALLDHVKIGDPVSIRNGESEIKAPIRAIVPVGDEVSRTLEVRIALSDPLWHIGSAVRVYLPTASPKTVIAAHRDALLLRANRISVFAINEENSAQQIDVELGTAEGDLIELIGDIEAGQSVVVRGAERLRDGQKVEIAEPARAAAS